MEFNSENIDTLSYILSSDYWEVDEREGCIVFDMSGSDWTCHNVETYKGDGVIQEEDGECYTDVDITQLPEGCRYQDDIVTNYNEEEEWSDTYTNLEEDTILWVHEVHSGTLAFYWDGGNVSSWENTRYCSPQTFVYKGGKLQPLVCR